MSTINVLSMTGEVVGSVELNDSIFGIEPNQAVVHEVVKNHLANFFQTDVQLTCNAKGKGKIAITFKDEQELERIIALLDKLKS